jgi:hypothetical protein
MNCPQCSVRQLRRSATDECNRRLIVVEGVVFLMVTFRLLKYRNLKLFYRSIKVIK